MGIGQQHDLAATLAQSIQKWQGVVTQADQVLYFPAGCVDINLKPLTPVVIAIPVQGAEYGGVFLFNAFTGRGQADVVLLGQQHRYPLQPEVIVKVQIQQRTVHIQQDGVNGVPI